MHGLEIHFPTPLELSYDFPAGIASWLPGYYIKALIIIIKLEARRVGLYANLS